MNTDQETEERLSIHDLTRRSTGTGQLYRVRRWPFNSRPHKEVDHYVGALDGNVYLSIHDLTRRSTVFTTSPKFSKSFQFTTSQGGRLLSEIRIPREKSFNSRPHKEVDVISIPDISLHDLSIHDLTRRSTLCMSCLVRGVIPFNSRPHKVLLIS